MLKVSKNILILITGLIWLMVSFSLIYRAIQWTELMTTNAILLAIFIALFIGVIKTYLIFHKLTVNNILRIQQYLDEKISVFLFHECKHKILIVVMIVGGSSLRHSPLVPKSVLMPIYLGIGLAMLYSAFLYFRTLLRKN